MLKSIKNRIHELWKEVKGRSFSLFESFKNKASDLRDAIVISEPFYLITEFFSFIIHTLIKGKNIILFCILYMTIIGPVCYVGYVAWQSLFNGSDKKTFTSTAISELGTFGDFFGGISNPVIGAVGFIVLTITISMQIKQNRETIKQNFESSFFNLLNLQNNIIENLDFEGATARASFTEFLKKNENVLYPKYIYKLKMTIKESKAKVFYKDYNINHNGVFGHYFRNLYRILKMIHDSNYSEEEKKRHARILRAQLSMDELVILFLNCLPGVCDDGAFSDLLIQYQILEHLSVKKFPDSQDYQRRFIGLEFIIGGKVRVSYKEVGNYFKKSSHYYYSRVHSGAFGRNSSPDLAVLKNKLIIFHR